MPLRFVLLLFALTLAPVPASSVPSAPAEPLLRAERERTAVLDVPTAPQPEARRNVERLRVETRERLDHVHGEMAALTSEIARLSTQWNGRFDELSSLARLLTACLILVLGVVAAILLVLWQRLRALERHPRLRLAFPPEPPRN